MDVAKDTGIQKGRYEMMVGLVFGLLLCFLYY